MDVRGRLRKIEDGAFRKRALKAHDDFGLEGIIQLLEQKSIECEEAEVRYMNAAGMIKVEIPEPHVKFGV